MAKKKFERLEMVLYGVLSYPDLSNPKPFKGKVYYRTDILFDQDDPQLAILKKKINKVRVLNWGADKDEWPEKARKRFIQDGNEREDQPTYQDKMYVTVATQTPVDVIDTKGRAFSAAMVRGGMFAKVALSISPWENDGDEGMSLYLQGVMVDTAKAPLPGFGGKKSAKALFGIKDSEEDTDDEDDGEEVDEDEDEDDKPRGKKSSTKKKASRHDDEEEDEDTDDTDGEEDDGDDEEDEEASRSKKKRPPATAKKKKSKPAVDDEDDAEDEDDY